jgi:hypothetical protein
MMGWDSRIQRGMGPCTQAQSTSVTVTPAVSAEQEGEGGGGRSEINKEPELKGGGEVALHRKGPERDLLRCLRSIGESRSRKSRSTFRGRSARHCSEVVLCGV